MFYIVYIPPLYLPRVILQEGQVWVTACMLSIQKGMRQHGQIPNTQRAPQMIQERALLSDLVLQMERVRQRVFVWMLSDLVVMLF